MIDYTNYDQLIDVDNFDNADDSDGCALFRSGCDAFKKAAILNFFDTTTI